jgi:hypothetical protein
MGGLWPPQEPSKMNPRPPPQAHAHPLPLMPHTTRAKRSQRRGRKAESRRNWRSPGTRHTNAPACSVRTKRTAPPGREQGRKEPPSRRGMEAETPFGWPTGLD